MDALFGPVSKFFVDSSLGRFSGHTTNLSVTQIRCRKYLSDLPESFVCGWIVEPHGILPGREPARGSLSAGAKMPAGSEALNAWLPASGTHNELRFAAHPLSGVQGDFSALSTNTSERLEMCS